jgi:hypothetical protein
MNEVGVMNAAAEMEPLGDKSGSEIQVDGSELELSSEKVYFGPKLERAFLNSTSRILRALVLTHDP